MNDTTDTTETGITDDAICTQDEGRACEQDARFYQKYVTQLEQEAVLKAPKSTKKKTQNDG